MTVVVTAVTMMPATMTQVAMALAAVGGAVDEVLPPGQVEVAGEGDLRALLLDLLARKVAIAVNTQFKVCSFPPNSSCLSASPKPKQKFQEVASSRTTRAGRRQVQVRRTCNATGGHQGVGDQRAKVLELQRTHLFLLQLDGWIAKHQCFRPVVIIIIECSPSQEELCRDPGRRTYSQSTLHLFTDRVMVQREESLTCHCGVEAERRVTQKGANQGKPYWACAERKCASFIWETDLQGRKNVIQPVDGEFPVLNVTMWMLSDLSTVREAVAKSPSNPRACFHCGQEGHFMSGKKSSLGETVLSVSSWII